MGFCGPERLSRLREKVRKVKRLQKILNALSKLKKSVIYRLNFDLVVQTGSKLAANTISIDKRVNLLFQKGVSRYVNGHIKKKILNIVILFVLLGL